MEKLEAAPRFIEPGDEQDTVQALPIFVTKQMDDAARTHRSAMLVAIHQSKSNVQERLEND